MKYTELTEKELDEVVNKQIEYYNTVEDCCFTYEKAYKRIHQVMTIEDAMCKIQYDDNGNMTGFCMGYYKQFDDLLAYFLEEIVIFTGFHNLGYGSEFMAEIEEVVKKNGAEHLELISVNDAHHMHFYEKAGLYAAKNLSMMGKHWQL